MTTTFASSLAGAFDGRDAARATSTGFGLGRWRGSNSFAPRPPAEARAVLPWVLLALGRWQDGSLYPTTNDNPQVGS